MEIIKVGDAIQVKLVSGTELGFVTGFNKKDGQEIVDYHPGTTPPTPGTLGSKWAWPSDVSRYAPVTVAIVFGEQAARHIADGKVSDDVVDGFGEYEFATQELADAFLQGVEAASGFLGHYELDETEIKKVKRKISRKG